MRTSATAPRSTGFSQFRPVRRHVHFALEEPAGTPILLNAGVAGLSVVIEIAWGATLTASPNTWSWVDVTADVQTAGGKNIAITLGRADEASVAQPAQCLFTLDNRSGAYSKGGQSPNYPNVKINTPLRVRILTQSRSYTRFYGYAVGFSPDWDHTGKHAVVNVRAEGALRRIQLNKQPIQSALRRSIPALPNLIDYWPCEDGALATTFQSANGGAAMTPTQVVTPASFTGLASSAPLPVVGAGGGWAGAVRPYASTGQNQVRWMINIPSSGLTDNTILAKVTANGTAAQFDIIYYTSTGGSLGLNIYDANLTQLYSSPVIVGLAPNGSTFRMSLGLTNSGGDLNWELVTYIVGNPAGGVGSNTLVGRNTSTVWGVFVSPNLTENGMAAGHITVENAVTSIFDIQAQVNAYAGETVDQRMIRLSSENNVPFVEITDPTQRTANYNLGNQPIDTYINCMRDGEVVDQGMLCDGLNNGLSYFVRSLKTSQPTSMTLDASAGDMAMPFTPLDDDIVMRNRQIVTVKSGGDFVAQDDTTPFSVASVGLYDQALTVNFHDNRYDDPIHLAEWLVHVGTVSSQVGYRYPHVELDLARRPNQINAWLATPLLGRIDVVGMHTARTQAQLGTIPLLVEGWTETISQVRWNVAINAASYEPWRVLALADVTGDVNEFICHLDTDGCVVTSPVAIGASSFSVTNTGVTPWTTANDDFPFQVDIGGVPVTVTAIGAVSGNNQTFTVDSTTVIAQMAAGTAVSVWSETVLGY